MTYTVLSGVLNPAHSPTAQPDISCVFYPKIGHYLFTRFHGLLEIVLGRVKCVTQYVTVLENWNSQKIVIIYHYNGNFTKVLCIKYIFDNIICSVLLLICLLYYLTKKQDALFCGWDQEVIVCW